MNCPDVYTHYMGTREVEMEVPGALRKVEEAALSWWVDTGQEPQLTEVSCSQESLHHLEHQCRTSPARQAVIISSSASSLPGATALQTMTLLSKWKISVPGFQRALLQFGKGTALLKSWIKWENFRTAVKVSLKCPEHSIYVTTKYCVGYSLEL